MERVLETRRKKNIKELYEQCGVCLWKIILFFKIEKPRKIRNQKIKLWLVSL